MKKFIAVVLLVAVFATLGLTACGSKNDNTATTTAPQGTSGETKATVKTAKDGVLTMVTNAEFPPYEYYESDEITGLDVDFAQAICDKLGMELEIEDMAFDSIIPAVNSGKADMGVAGMTVTPDREKEVLFSDSYYSSKQVIIVKDDFEE